jgi:hypothetical protein
VKAQPSENEPITGEDQAVLEKTPGDRMEELDHPIEPLRDDVPDLDAQPPEEDATDYDEGPPSEIAEGDLDPEREVEVADQSERPSVRDELEQEPIRQPEPERPERFERRPPERQDRRDFGRRGRQDQRPQRVQESRPPEPPRERIPATPAAVHEAIELVNQVIDNLRESLEDMEEVLETLEFAERQKTADEQEIDSLRRMLKQMHRPREGGGPPNPPQQHRGR